MAASVSSLDGDLRKLRLDKYSPAAAKEARTWIESTLGERLPGSGDLLEALKDGTALCRLANMAIPPPGIRYKKSAMPFVQMENISQFLNACKAPPLNLHEHDVFLTVDLYEAKDPAQVLQCLGAFSRAANRVSPSAFPTAIGPRAAGGAGGPASPPARSTTSASNMSSRPSVYGTANRNSQSTPLSSNRSGESGAGASASSALPSSGSGRWSPTKSPAKSPAKSPTSTSTWSQRNMEGATSPAWNIAQYGYMGGASQGNLGISFGGRRQITSAGPHVPNAYEKLRLRKEKEAEEARLKEEEEQQRRAALEAEEERARLEEERRWEEETQQLRAEEKRKADEERRRWEEEERQWKITEEKRKREEAEAEARLEEERKQRLRSSNSHRSTTSGGAGVGAGDPRLHGQFLSQYQAEHGSGPSRGASTRSVGDAGSGGDGSSEYSDRIKELEQQLEKARQREEEYERERKERASRPATATAATSSRARSRSRPAAATAAADGAAPSRHDSWSRNDREVLRTPRSQSRHQFADVEPPIRESSVVSGAEFSSPPQPQQQQVDDYDYSQAAPPPSKSPRPLPDPRVHSQQQQQPALPPVSAMSPPPLRSQRTGERQQQQQPYQQPVPAPAPEDLQPQSPPQKTGFFQKLRPHRTGERAQSRETSPVRVHQTGESATSTPGSPNKLAKMRPLPDPSSYSSPPPQPPRQQQYQPQAQNFRPLQNVSQQQHYQSTAPAHQTYARDIGSSVAERDAEDRRRVQTQQATKAGGAASKSLLEREMELERERQREWEEAQKQTAAAPRQAEAVDGVDGRWDVNQWSGYTGGDSQNRGSQGIGSGRRQIVGPRPLPGGR